MDGPFNVLSQCTGNSAGSIMSEVMMNAMGAPRFRAFSAGSHPTGRVNPFAIELLQKNRLPTEGLRSKGWDEFAGPGAPELDFVFTVCDSAAGEACPPWPGQPISAHWGVEDPAAAMSVFERYLTLWVAICIVVGIGSGQLFPALMQAIGGLEVAAVNLPVGLLIWVMIIPIRS